MRISLTLQNEGHGLHRHGCWVSLKFSSFVNVSVEPSKGVWEVFRIPFPLAQRRKIKERGEEGDWDVWGARCAAGNSLINFRNRFSQTGIHFTLSPTFLSLVHWNDCDRGFGCLFAIQVVAASHSPEAWVGSQRNPPTTTTTSRARATQSRASSLGKSSCMEEPPGWMLGCWRVERSSQSRPGLNLTDSFIWASVYYSLAWPPSLLPAPHHSCLLSLSLSLSQAMPS